MINLVLKLWRFVFRHIYLPKFTKSEYLFQSNKKQSEAIAFGNNPKVRCVIKPVGSV